MNLSPDQPTIQHHHQITDPVPAPRDINLPKLSGIPVVESIPSQGSHSPPNLTLADTPPPVLKVHSASKAESLSGLEEPTVLRRSSRQRKPPKRLSPLIPIINSNRPPSKKQPSTRRPKRRLPTPPSSSTSSDEEITCKYLRLRAGDPLHISATDAMNAASALNVTFPEDRDIVAVLQDPSTKEITIHSRVLNPTL
ncbi:hypothetical protein CEE45_17055 [Candidatus Heimdallarchaeota archaeon B3_Heim]|nr:MAG: hypothetical protein CEE45_17055 [Candidatus Heimdallarchaeota archaeon B3_Heim]